jgi:hypothetical protein
MKAPPESPNRDKSKAHVDEQSAIPDLTPEPVDEPEPPPGQATTPINLFDEAGENPAPIPESYRRIHRVYGGTLQDDDGTHLDGGISDDSTWRLLLKNFNSPNVLSCCYGAPCLGCDSLMPNFFFLDVFK